MRTLYQGESMTLSIKCFGMQDRPIVVSPGVFGWPSTVSGEPVWETDDASRLGIFDDSFDKLTCDIIGGVDDDGIVTVTVTLNADLNGGTRLVSNTFQIAYKRHWPAISLNILDVTDYPFLPEIGGTQIVVMTTGALT